MKRPSIDAAGLAQLSRKERLLRDVIRSGGTDRWSHLFSHGHKHPTVRLCIREGSLVETEPYRYEITDAGRRCIAELDHAAWTGAAA